MNRISKVLALLFVSVLQFDCSRDQNSSGPIVPSPPALQSEPLLPLTIGNHWEYSDSTIYSPDSVVVIYYSWTILGKQNILSGNDSVEVFIWRIESAGGDQYDYYLRNTPEGLVHYMLDEGDAVGHFSLKSLVLKFPMKQGDSWRESQGDVADRKSCLSTDTLIAMPVGTFHAYIVRRGGSTTSWHSDEYFKENFGRVGGYAEYLSYSKTVVVRTSLLSYGIY